MNLKDNKNFWLLQLGQFISQLGSSMTGYSLILWAYKSTGSVFQLSLMAICSLMPTVALSYIGGDLADKFNKKILILTADSFAAIFSFITFLLVLNNALEIWHLYTFNIVLGITNAFQGPASRAVFSHIVSKEQYMKMSGIQSFSESLTTILSPVIASAFYAFAGLKGVILTDLATFLFASFTLLLFVKIPRTVKCGENTKTYGTGFHEGLCYLMKNKSILSLILLMGFINLIASIYNCNLAPMVLSRTGNNEIQLGVVSGAVGFATLTGSFIVTVMKAPKKRVSLVLNIIAAAFLLCNNALGIGRNFYVWTIAVFLGNCLIPVAIANVDYLMRINANLEFHGRIFAAHGTILYLARLVGY